MMNVTESQPESKAVAGSPGPGVSVIQLAAAAVLVAATLITLAGYAAWSARLSATESLITETSTSVSMPVETSPDP